MADIARVGFVADTSSLKTAKTDLEALPPAAAKVETASGKLTQSIKSTASTISGQFASSISSAKTALIGFAAGIIAAFSFQAIISGLSNVADKIDDISKAASKLKVGMGDLQALAHAADLAGLSFDELATVAQKMNRILGDAIAKGKENSGVFKLLGISAKELAATPIDERFGKLADRMNALNLTSEQTALILAKLGDRNGSLAALFEGGSAAIQDASDQLDRFNGKLTNEQGKDIEAMNDAFTNLGAAIESMYNKTLAFIAPMVAAVVNGIAEVIGFINRAIGGLVSFITALFSPLVRIIVGAFNLIWQGLANGLNGLDADFRNVFGVGLYEIVKKTANDIYNAFSATFQGVAIIWERLPDVLGDAAVSAVNFVIGALNEMIAASIKGINALIAAIPDWMKAGNGIAFDPNSMAIPEMNNPFAGAAKGTFTDSLNAMANQMKVDNFAASVTKTTETAVKPATAALTDFSGALDTAGNKAGGAAEKLTELQKIGKELDALGAPFDQAKSAFDKLRELQQNGIITGDQYTAMLGRMQAAFIAAGGTAAQWSKIISANTVDMTAALKEFTTNALTSTGDAIADLAVEGKIDFKSLADSIIRDLIRVMWQALVVKPIISAVFPGLGFADGGVFSGGGLQPFADGGVVSRPMTFAFSQGGTAKRGLMGEAGPEAIMPLVRGADGKLGVNAHGASGGASGPVFNNEVVIQYQGTGDEANDRKNAAGMGEALREQMKQIAIEQFQAATQYGGYANPRGVR